MDIASLNRLPLGKWLGVPVFLHWSWLLFVVILGYFSPQNLPTFIGLFFIVLLHELGHCAAGNYYKTYIRDIVLYPIGGAASMEIPKDPKQEFVIAIAGPLVNVALLPVFALISGYHSYLSQLAVCNIVLLVFNLIPALPMDGGRVLRSVLVMLTHNYLKSTKIAARISQVISVIFFAFGVWYYQFMLALIGVFVFFEAKNEIDRAKSRSGFLAEKDDISASAAILSQMRPPGPKV